MNSNVSRVFQIETFEQLCCTKFAEEITTDSHATYLEFEINLKANTAEPMRPIDFESDVYNMTVVRYSVGITGTKRWKPLFFMKSRMHKTLDYITHDAQCTKKGRKTTIHREREKYSRKLIKINHVTKINK